ncbi:DnaA regulatory inactivator Hda [Paraburkholderia caffeinitolerans]|uniref:DnaA regulatory inactivator Hda n=1 Tax=Paraburkholderia caffeinitolerans TaxID=1723730 RepID=A0A6J5FE22_9BURK|nr:DnaA regulatory inactivator Hda [Paraburkholderia caffeinitolerans]
MQRQLTLDLGTPPPSTFDNFHTGANTELVARLRGLDAALAAGPAVDPKADRTFYVWGEPGNGRSHLLHALAFETPPGHVRYIGPKSGLAAFTFDARVPIYAVDDCDSLSGAQQIALFNLFNEVRSHPNTALVATGNAPPMGLTVREDLRTRLGWGLVFHLAPLSDAGKAAVLKQAARERGINLADDVPAYLLTHFRRDMPSLMRLLDALDRFSLEQKRAVTLPLLRTMLANSEGEETSDAAAPGETDDAADSRIDDATAAAELDETSGTPLAEEHDTPEPAGNSEQGVELELFPSYDAPNATAPAEPSSAAYEAPRAPALHPRAPLSAPPFQPPTDNVEGELGARFRDVVHRELGAELQGEVEADVSGEMNGELDGDVDPAADPAAPTAPEAEQPDATRETPPAGPTAANPPPSAPASEPSSDSPDAAAGAGNGFTRFK